MRYDELDGHWLAGEGAEGVRGAGWHAAADDESVLFAGDGVDEDEDDEDDEDEDEDEDEETAGDDEEDEDDDDEEEEPADVE